MQEFTRELTTEKPPATLRREFAAESRGQLAKHNYELTTQNDYEVGFHKRYWPKWAIVVAVLLFPIGLVALFVKHDATITAKFTPEGDGTRLLVTGQAPTDVAAAFEQMEI